MLLSLYLAALDDQSNEEQFIDVYNTYKRLVYHTAYKIMGDSYLAEDVLQEVFLYVAKNFSKIHPPSLREGYYKTETPVPGSDTGVLGGRGWIRTTEAEKQQIYSLSPLATREHAHILFAVIADCLYILSSEVAFVNYFFHGFSLFLSFSIFLRFTAIKALSITAKDPKTFSVLRSFWSW